MKCMKIIRHNYLKPKTKDKKVFFTLNLSRTVSDHTRESLKKLTYESLFFT